MDIFNLKGQRILITGASSGIGRACAILCSRAGADVILIARDEVKLKETHEFLSPGNHFEFGIDLLNFKEIEEVISKIVIDHRKINGFIHSAGSEITIPFSMLKPHHFEQLFAINTIAGFEIARILSKSKYFNAEVGASFVFISSIMGLLGIEGKVAYCASKGAIIAGVRAMALELATKKIRVNCISPAIVQTKMAESLFETLPDSAVQKLKDMHPMGLGKPEDVANAVLFLLSSASSWITGSNLIVDGGYSIK